jgi:hypothetical protein
MLEALMPFKLTSAVGHFRVIEPFSTLDQRHLRGKVVTLNNLNTALTGAKADILRTAI